MAGDDRRRSEKSEGVFGVVGRHALVAPALIVLLCVLSVPTSLAAPAQVHRPQALPGRQVEVRAGATTRELRPVMPALGSRSGGQGAGLMASETLAPTATADIQVTYTGFSEAAQDAFQAAIDIWETQVVSSQVIHVDATWEPLGTGVLGQAGPKSFYLLEDDRAYPAALAEALCSCELEDTVEIEASFNSTFSAWYLGTDGNAPNDKYDFTTVVLHELGHGLGFLSSFYVVNTKGYWGLTNNGVNFYALRYDVSENSAASGGVVLTSYSPTGTSALKTELTDGSVYFGGAEVVAAYGGRAPLYAPGTWNGGSSNSHFDEASFPAGTADALMTPFLANGEVLHVPGPVTLALLRDIGWTTAGVGPTDTTDPVVSPPLGTILEAQTLGATALVNLAWPAATDDSAIASYQLQRKKNSGSWVDVALPSPTATGVDVGLAPGASYVFRLRASDTAGNTSDWVTTAAATLALLQEKAGAIAYSGSGWKRVSLSGASGGKVKKNGTAGRTATLSFNGTSVAFVSTRSAARGIAEIWLDGVLQDTVDLYKASTSKRWVIWAPDAPLPAAAHTLEVRVTGTRNPSSAKNRIDVDAFLVWP